MFDVMTHLESSNGVVSCVKGNKQSITATSSIIEQLQQNSSILQKAIAKLNSKGAKKIINTIVPYLQFAKKHPVGLLSKSSSETKAIGNYQALWQLHCIHYIVF